MLINKNKLRLRKFLMCSISLLAIFLLGGCANILKKMGYEPIASATKKDCQQAQILMTDLTMLEEERQYMLPDGRLCPSSPAEDQSQINNDDKNNSKDKKEKNNGKDSSKNK